MESDYIKREDAINDIQEWATDLAHPEFIVKEDAVCVLKKLPAADVEPVVRCKDCKWWDGIECRTRDIDVVDDEEYCSYGERKEQEHGK